MYQKQTLFYIFLALLRSSDASGQLVQWARQTAAPTIMFDGGSASDPDGNYYYSITGAQQYLFDYNTDDGQLVNAVANDFLLVKYDSTGARQWIRSIKNGLVGKIFFRTNEQQLCVTGSFADSVVFAPGVTLNAAHGFFLARYTSDGTLLNARLLARDAPAYTLGVDVTMDDTGNILLTGTLYVSAYIGEPSAGDTLLTTPPGGYALLAKLDNLGKFEWVQSWKFGDEIRPGRTAADAADNIYVAGYFQGFGYLDNTYFWGFDTSDDLFLIKFSPTGSLLWSKHLATSGEDFLGELVVKPGGDVYLNNVFGDSVVTFNRGRPDQSTVAVANPYPSNQIDYVFRFNSDGTLVGAVPFATQGGSLVARPGEGLAMAVACDHCTLFPDAATPVSLTGDWPRVSYFLVTMDDNLEYQGHSDWLFSAYNGDFTPLPPSPLPDGDFYVATMFRYNLWFPSGPFTSLGNDQELMIIKTTGAPALPVQEVPAGYTFRIMPNPAGDRFVVETPEVHDAVSVVITDVHGQVVFNKKQASESVEVNSKNWKSGVYNVSIITPNGIYSQKCIKH